MFTPSLPLTNIQILVIEDQVVISMALVEELNKLGALVTEADSLVQALTLLETSSFDLILSNVIVKGEDACLFMQQWRDREKIQGREMTLAIALPSEVSKYSQAEMLANGFQMAIVKPFSFDQITAMVCQLLDRQC